MKSVTALNALMIAFIVYAAFISGNYTVGTQICLMFGLVAFVQTKRGWDAYKNKEMKAASFFVCSPPVAALLFVLLIHIFH
jgi:hypothetical protein